MPYSVEFEKFNTSLHSCNNLCKQNHGKWCYENELEPVEEKVEENYIEQNKELELEIKTLQARNCYLNGQISVYEKYMFNKEEN